MSGVTLAELWRTDPGATVVSSSYHADQMVRIFEGSDGNQWVADSDDEDEEHTALRLLNPAGWVDPFAEFINAMPVPAKESCVWLH